MLVKGCTNVFNQDYSRSRDVLGIFEHDVRSCVRPI